MIEKLMKMGQKHIYLIYTTAMFLLIIFQIIYFLWNTNIVTGIGVGFNIGMWMGFSLGRLGGKW